MQKIIRIQTFLLLIAIIAVTLACSFYAKTYAFQQQENFSNQESALISNQIEQTLRPLLPKLLSEDGVGGEHGIQVTDFALLNDISRTTTQLLKDTPITHVYIKDVNNNTLFSKEMVHHANRVFHQIPPKINLTNKTTTVLKRSDSEIITAYTTPLFVQGNDKSSGFLYIVADHSQARQQTQKKVKKFTLWGQGAALLIALATLLFNANNIKFVNILKEKIRQLSAKLHDTESTDQLTKLINRKSFFKAIDEFALENAEHAFSTFTVFLLNLDNFRSINETHGHYAGDRVLVQASQRIKNAVPKEATIARLESNTFGLIIENTIDLQNISDIAKNILSQFDTPFLVDEKHIFCTTSIGIVMSDKQKPSSAEVLVRNAEMSMYKAKNNGHGTYEIFTPNMYIESLARFKAERDIQRGIKAKEMFNRYQPIVDLNTGLTHSFEALARWQHPEKGELAPYHFIDIAEKAGFITDIDRNALVSALEDLSEWHKDLPTLQDLNVNVNHSAKDFSQRPTMDIILDELSKNKLSPKSLKIELTESSIIENENLASTIFESLRNKGVHFCMDDFGTGFSSISYLRKLNFDMLKIDRSFVMDIMEDDGSKKIVQTIINLGKNLGISVTAEGVETKEQANKLKEMGCQYAQGYYFAKPMLKSEVIGFLREQIQKAQTNPD